MTENTGERAHRGGSRNSATADFQVLCGTRVQGEESGSAWHT